MTVGERIQEARKQAGMKQSDLAEKLGVAVITIGQYERGKRQPRIDQLQRIADALNISISLLLSKDEREIFDTGVSEGQEALIQVYRNYDGYSFTRTELFLIRAFSELNDEGQKKAVERVEELTEIPRYRAETAPESTLDSNEGKDTPLPSDAAEGPQENH